ncbi:MAG: transcriptional repressor [Bacilli bacterium]|nr:transcriptional repressor [Bacilli bacterium]
MSYKTKQKDVILDIIKNKKNEFTIKDIYVETEKSIGLTTIYRLVDKLIKNGTLSKNIGEDNVTYYQYLEDCNCDNHFYLKCTKCGKLIHVDCDCIGDLYNHILSIHKFSLSKEHIIINGICNICGGNV